MYKPITPAYKKAMLQKGHISFISPEKKLQGPRFESHVIYVDNVGEQTTEMLLAKCHTTFTNSALYLENLVFSNTIIGCTKSYQLMILELIVEAAEQDAQLLGKTMLVITTNIPLFEEIVINNSFRLRQRESIQGTNKFSAVKHLKEEV